ncbi:hypothetical protein B566_EDAN007809 [Ephemera danica]|nr:hypothetical protein B566_EDAN007809 [Ephemera danica]
MTICGFCCNRLLIVLVVCIAIAYLPGLPPDLSFEPFSPTPPRELEGSLQVNEKLNGAQHILVGQIKNPEGFAVANNTLYTGVEGGNVVKIIGDKMIPVANLAHPCIDSWDEKNCGRLLGLQFDKHGMLYVVDAYYGIYKVNVNTGKVLHLISTDKPIEGKMAKFANSVTVAKDGTLYWTVSSCDVVYWLAGPKKGTWDVFVDGLPGLPDNVRSNDKGGFFVSLVLARSSSMPAVTDILGSYPVFRRFLVRLLYLIEAPFDIIHRAYPNIYTGIITHWVSNNELLTPVLPKALIVVEVSETGEIIDSLQSTDKRVTFVSDFVEVDNFYYLGSPVNNFLGRVIAPAKSTRQ